VWEDVRYVQGREMPFMYALIAQKQKKKSEKKWLIMKREIAYKFVLRQTLQNREI
jgi:hypothetical protein